MNSAVSATMTGNRSNVLLIGRILIGILFLVAGIMKAMNIAGTTGYMTKLGFPAPELMAYLSTIIELAAGVLLIIGWQTRRVAWVLIVYVLIATGMAHRFWEYEPAQRVNQINHFLKNLALIGAMLYIVVGGPGSASVDKS
ncbi:MAG TPA: DoxX family protein [Burkholderiales bacterium]|jgi:putative oxidoreductase|nr:DoxX family protein [Burkholderiales bacterium]